MEETSITKKYRLPSFDKFALFFLSAGILVSPLVALPVLNFSLEVLKKVFFVGSIALALIFWLLARLEDKKVYLPKSPTYLAGKIFFLVALVSALLSYSPWSSILGLGVESGSVLSLLSLFSLLFLVIQYSRSKQRFVNLYIGLFAVFAIAFLFQIIRYSFGNFLPWGIFDYGAANLIGKWNDFGVFASVMTLSSVVMLELFPLKEAKQLRIFIWFSLIASILVLSLVNFYLNWIVLAVFLFIIYAYNSSFASSKAGASRFVRTSLFVLIFSLAFIGLAKPLSYDTEGKAHEGFIAKPIRVLSEKLKIASLEVRPSLKGTYLMTRASIKQNPILGVGPNLFSSVWLKNKPAGVNDTQFWYIEPDFGIGFVPTFFVTTGLLGGLALLAFVLMLAYSGFRVLLNPKGDSLDKTLILLSFIGTAYLWTMLVLYVPETSILIMTFALTGLFMGRLADGGHEKLYEFKFSESPKTKFIGSVSTVVVGIVSVGYLFIWLTSTSSLFLMQMANKDAQAGNLDKAVAKVSKASTLNPQDLYFRALTQLNLMQMGALLGKQLPKEQLMAEYAKLFEDAKKNSDEAVNHNPENYQNYITRGGIYENIMALGVNGSYELAKQNYESAQTKNPFGPDMNLVLARLEINNKSISTAEKYLEKSLTLKKDYVDAIFLQSQIYAEKGFMDSAIQRAEYAAMLAPNDIGVLFQLGYLKYRNADYRGSAEAMQAAVNLSPNYANALYFLGLSLDKLGMKEQAVKAFTAIAQSNPENQEVKSILNNLNSGRAALAGSDAPKAETIKKAD